MNENERRTCNANTKPHTVHYRFLHQSKILNLIDCLLLNCGNKIIFPLYIVGGEEKNLYSC